MWNSLDRSTTNYLVVGLGAASLLGLTWWKRQYLLTYVPNCWFSKNTSANQDTGSNKKE